MRYGQIKAVVFGIGNTLIPYDELAVAREILKYSSLKNDSLELVFENIFRSGIHYAFLIGFARAGEYFQKIKEKLDLDLS